MNIVVGVTRNGERLRFERWAYDEWVYGVMRDRWLHAQFERCVRFQRYY